MFNQRIVEYYNENIIEQLSRLYITVCGAGALGSHMAINLVRHGAKQITVVDNDRVEEYNIGTQVYDSRDLGKWKTTALQMKCFFINSTHIATQNEWLDDGNVHRLLRGNDLIINTFDNSDSRRVVHEFCLREGVPCLNVGMNVNYAGIRWSNENYVVPHDDEGLDVCDYPLALNLVQITSAVASEIILDWIATGNKIEKIILLRDLDIKNP